MNMQSVMLKQQQQQKRMALVVGCNYPDKGEGLTLSGCHNDARVMRRMLMEKLRFQPECIKMLIDSPGSPEIMPTGARIKSEIYAMIRGAKAGDVLFFYFSGHGTDTPDTSLRKHEAIIASDLNPINRFDFRQMVDRLPKGASFTIMADSCNSGGLIDKEPVQIGPHRRSSLSSASHQLEEDEEDDMDVDELMLQVEGVSSRPKMIPYETLFQAVSNQTGLNHPDIRLHMLHLFGSDASLLYTLPHQHLPKPLKADQGILLSGCQPDEYSYQTKVGGVDYGAFTNAFHHIVRKTKATPPNLSNRKIILMARRILELQNRNDPDQKQHPCLYCSKKNAYAIFLANP